MNRDVNPLDSAKRDAGPILALIDNEPLAQHFAAFEKRAVAWKRRYTAAGVIGLLCSLLGVVALDYQLTMKDLLGPAPALSVAGTVFGSIGLFCSFYLLAWKPKERWLFARFGAEWLRCAKFRLFLHLPGLHDRNELKRTVKAETRKVLDRFSVMMDHGASVMSDFSPFDALGEVVFPSGTSARPDWLGHAKRVYLQNRIEVQLYHFSARTENRKAHLRPLHSIGDWVLLSALALLLIQVGSEATILLPFMEGEALTPASQAILAFATIFLFALGAARLIFERGRNLQVDADRYRYFHDQIMRERAKLDASDLFGFLEIVERVELACLEELGDFCRDVSASDYGV